MLVLKVESTKLYNPNTERFINVPATELVLEHSLLSISKWEMKYEKPFLSQLKTPKSADETNYYIKCMTINSNKVHDNTYLALTSEHINTVNNYIDSKRSATIIKKQPDDGDSSSEILTSEVLYAYMVGLKIPFECEKWFLNRLIMLIRVRSLHVSPPKKMSKEELADYHRRVNAERRAQVAQQ